MARNTSRPMSPHLFDGMKLHYIWGPHMTVSILNRVTGAALSIAGLVVLVWWLIALASGPESYASFAGHAGAWYGQLVLIGLSWCYAFHLLAGLRHFVMDIGAGFELRTNRAWAWGVIAGSFVLTALVWLIVYGKAL